MSDTLQFVVVKRKTQVTSCLDRAASRRQTKVCRTFRLTISVRSNRYELLYSAKDCSSVRGLFGILRLAPYSMECSRGHTDVGVRRRLLHRRRSNRQSFA